MPRDWTRLANKRLIMLDIDYFNCYPDHSVAKQFWNITENYVFKYLKQKALVPC